MQKSCINIFKLFLLSLLLLLLLLLLLSRDQRRVTSGCVTAGQLRVRHLFLYLLWRPNSVYFDRQLVDPEIK